MQGRVSFHDESVILAGLTTVFDDDQDATLTLVSDTGNDRGLDLPPRGYQVFGDR
jgi:hypothetical protein